MTAASTERSDGETPGRHRRAAEHALVEAQRNPVLSVEQSFHAAEVHALLAIEQQLGDLLSQLREHPPGGAPKPVGRARTARTK